MRERSPSRLNSRSAEKVRETFWSFEGGLNLVDPPIDMRPGTAIAALNLEVDVQKGYRRIDGYERFDGAFAPSDAEYIKCSFTSGGTSTLVVAATVSGDTSNGTATILAVNATDTGWASGTAAGTLVLEMVNGTLQAENISLEGTAAQANVATISSLGTNTETTAATHEAYLGSVAANRRSRISAVPGTGICRGGFFFNGLNYAFRDGTDGAGHMYKSSGTGWTEVTAWATPLRFYNGTYAINEGDELTIAGSGTVTGTAVVHRVGVHSGVLEGTASIAEGYIYCTSITGTYTPDTDFLDTIQNDNLVNFDAGVTIPIAGTILKNDTTAFQATVTGWVKTSGTWTVGGVDAAAGYITVKGWNGTAAANNEELYMETAGGERILVGLVNGTAQPVNQTAALVNGTDGFVAQSFSTGGTYRAIQENFTGEGAAPRIYFTNDVDDHAFEFDGTTITPILLFEEDRDQYGAAQAVRGHKEHLFVQFGNGLMLNSSLGDPFSYNGLTGAAEFTLDDTISAMNQSVGDTLVIHCRNSLYILYGNDASDWDLHHQSHRKVGAIRDSVQDMGTVWYLDDRGIQTIQASDAFGDFLQATISQKIWPLINELKTTFKCSNISKTKNQYRLFFDGNKGLYTTVGGDVDDEGNMMIGGIMPVLFQHQPVTAWYGDDVNGFEVSFFGGTDGFCYQLDKGDSFDGTAISFYCQTNYYHYGQPMRKKLFMGCLAEMDLDYKQSEHTVPVVQITPSYEHGYTDEWPGGDARNDQLGLYAPGGFWNVDNWAEFNWGSPVFPHHRTRMFGRGANMSLIFSGTGSVLDAPVRLLGCSVQYRNKREHDNA